VSNISLDELRRRLLDGQADPAGDGDANDAYVTPDGDFRFGSSVTGADPTLSKVPRKVFAA
jgi:hypothetical protein